MSPKYFRAYPRTGAGTRLAMRRRKNRGAPGILNTRRGTRLRNRFAGKTTTRTMTMTKKINQRAKHEALQSGSDSFSQYGLSKLKPFQYKMCLNNNDINFQYNESNTFECNVGLQAVDLVAWNYTYQIMSYMLNNIGMGATATNPSLQTSLGYGATNATFAHQLIPWDCHTVTYLSNSSNSIMDLTLYDVVLRHAITTNDRDQPVRLWDAASSAEGQTTQINTILGNTPFSSPTFCQYFKIYKVTHVKLAEGQMHTHVTRNTTKLQKNIQNLVTWGADLEATSGMLPYLTTYTMAVIHGSPCTSVTNPLIESSTTSVKLTSVSKYNYTFKQLPTPNTYNLATNLIPSSLTGGAEIIQMYTGQTQGTILA